MKRVTNRTTIIDTLLGPRTEGLKQLIVLQSRAIDTTFHSYGI